MGVSVRIAHNPAFVLVSPDSLSQSRLVARSSWRLAKLAVALDGRYDGCASPKGLYRSSRRRHRALCASELEDVAGFTATDAILEASARIYRRLVLVGAVGVAVGALPRTTVLRHRLGGSE